MDVARAVLDGDVAALDEVVEQFYGGDSGKVRRIERANERIGTERARDAPRRAETGSKARTNDGTSMDGARTREGARRDERGGGIDEMIDARAKARSEGAETRRGRRDARRATRGEDARTRKRADRDERREFED